jgi:hypothetical protein
MSRRSSVSRSSSRLSQPDQGGANRFLLEAKGLKLIGGVIESSGKKRDPFNTAAPFDHPLRRGWSDGSRVEKILEFRHRIGRGDLGLFGDCLGRCGRLVNLAHTQCQLCVLGNPFGIGEGRVRKLVRFTDRDAQLFRCTNRRLDRKRLKDGVTARTGCSDIIARDDTPLAFQSSQLRRDRLCVFPDRLELLHRLQSVCPGSFDQATVMRERCNVRQRS